MKTAKLSLLCVGTMVLMLFMAIRLEATQAYWSMEASTMDISRADSLTGFDVQKYTINLKVDDVNRYIEGWVEATVLAENTLNSIMFRLMGGSLTVDSVFVNGIPASYTHSEGIIDIALAASAGSTFLTKVYYSGNPGLSPAPYNIGLKFTTSGIYTLSNPDAGSYWWPSYDHPWDKALVDWQISVREDWLAAANGLRSAIVDTGDGYRTHFWESQFPIATYVIGFAAGPYIEFMQSAGDIPIQNFVLPGQLNNAMADFANVPAMIEWFGELFGPYPFEKYGHVVVNISPYAAMEHQTMTTFGAQYLTGLQNYESIVAHELAHQWYGNYLTPITMREVWLKESFATYSEALWVHRKSGWDAACEYIRNSIQNYYINWENNNGPHTIFNPEYNLMFAPPTYEKSASVLHMLRLKMGNEAFFPFIRALLSTFPNGNINTAEFIALAQSHSGMDLQQFFQQWIYSPGIPNAEVSVFRKNEAQIKVYARSSSPTATAFELEIPLRFTGVSDSLVVKAMPVWEANILSMPMAAQIDEVQIDPKNWVLLRQKQEIRMSLLSCLPYSGAVKLVWNPMPSDIPIAGYLVYRRSNGIWQQVSQQIIKGTEFTDNSVQNNQDYEYYVCAVDTDAYISLPSNILSARPIAFSFDLGMLVVDETRDGSGASISPTDAQVDDFYAAALDGFDYSTWDYATRGAPDLQELSRYPLVLWHTDDISEQYLRDNIDTISSYILSGGKILISGWKHLSVFEGSFMEQFLPGISINYYNSPALISLSSDSYAPLFTDSTKLASAWNGMLPMIFSFDGVQSPIYNAVMPDTNPGNGKAAALKIDMGGSLVLLGFPLYFMQADGVRLFLQQILPELYPGLVPPDPYTLPVSIHIYPNPRRNTTDLKVDVKNAIVQELSIYNLRGQKLLHLDDLPQNFGTINIPFLMLKDMANGSYIIKMKTDRGMFTRKTVVF